MLLGGRVERTAVAICLLVSPFTLPPHASLSVQQQEPVRCTETLRLADFSLPVGSLTALCSYFICKLLAASLPSKTVEITDDMSGPPAKRLRQSKLSFCSAREDTGRK